MSGYGVRLSDELRREIAQQSHRIRDEFWAVHDQLERFGAPRPIWYGQLPLPLPTGPPGARQTRPFGVNGEIVFRQAADHEVELIEVQWPTEVDVGSPGARLTAGRA